MNAHNAAALAELQDIILQLGAAKRMGEIRTEINRLAALSIRLGVALDDAVDRPDIIERVEDLERRFGFAEEDGSRMFGGVATAGIGNDRDAILHLFIRDCAGLMDIPFTVTSVVAEVIGGDLNITMGVNLS